MKFSDIDEINAYRNLHLGRARLPGYLNYTELAALLDVHPRTLLRWGREGKGPPRVVISDKVFFYSEEAVAAWLKSREVASGRTNPTKP